jgi:hypothetical protein
MSKVKLYCLKTDKVIYEVEPVDAREILAGKDCGVSAMTKAEREAAKESNEGPKEGSKPWIVEQLKEKGVEFDASASKADLEALLKEQE